MKLPPPSQRISYIPILDGDFIYIKGLIDNRAYRFHFAYTDTQKANDVVDTLKKWDKGYITMNSFLFWEFSFKAVPTSVRGVWRLVRDFQERN